MARILVIDDNRIVRETIQVMLERAGHDVVLAVDGDDGLRQLRQGLINLVICDIFMPNKEGIETIREIRKSAADLPIIATTGAPPAVESISGRTGPDYLEIMRGFGATRTIPKPFSASKLHALVEECLVAGGSCYPTNEGRK